MSASTPAGNLRATLDTNLFVSGLIRPGPPNQLLRAWMAHAFHLVTSSELRTEVADVLVRPKFDRYGITPERIMAVLDALAAAEQASPLADLPVVVRDPKDAKVLAAALGARVDYLVTGDSDLLVFAGAPALAGLKITTVRGFLGVLESGQQRSGALDPFLH